MLCGCLGMASPALGTQRKMSTEQKHSNGVTSHQGKKPHQQHRGLDSQSVTNSRTSILNNAGIQHIKRNSVAPASSCNRTNWPQVLLLGDSITQFNFSDAGFWGAMLADKLQRKCDVINRGFSGYNTRWYKLILPKLLNRDNVKDVVAMVIFLGANDCNLEDKCPRLHVPIQEYRQNLLDIIKFVKSIGVTKEQLMLVGPPPCDEEAWLKEALKEGYPAGVSNEQAARYSEVAKEVAEFTIVQYIDIYNTILNEKNWKSLLSDGLHFSREGSEVFFRLLWPHIEKRTHHLAAVFPEWDQVDYLNPTVSF